MKTTKQNKKKITKNSWDRKLSQRSNKPHK